MLQEEDRIRTIAGFLLKNNARYILQAPPEVAEFVKVAVLQAFNDPSIMIRNAASQDIVTFLGVLEPKNWPECLQQLVNALDSADLDKQEVSELIHFFTGCRQWRNSCVDGLANDVLSSNSPALPSCRVFSFDSIDFVSQLLTLRFSGCLQCVGESL